MLTGVRVSIKSIGIIKSGYIIIINFFIKSVRFEPGVVERENRFIFENKITVDLSLINTAKI